MHALSSWLFPFLFLVSTVFLPHESVRADQNSACFDLIGLARNNLAPSRQKLKIMTLNVGHIYRYNGPLSSAGSDSNPEAPTSRHKSADKLRSVFEDARPDIAVLQEVESLEVLKQFAAELKTQYRAFLIPGNDDEHLKNIGFLVRDDLPLEIEHRTLKNFVYPNPTSGKGNIKIFTRDAPVLILRKKGEDRPLFILMGIHFKSMKDRPQDPGSKLRRGAEIKASIEILKNLQREFGSDVPLVIAGDFNNPVSYSSEMKPLRELFPSAFDVALKTIPHAVRITHTFHKSLAEFDEELVPLGESIEMTQRIRRIMRGFRPGVGYCWRRWI